MRDLNIITVSGMINQNPVYKENKENPRKTLLHYNIIVYTGRNFYVGEELIHERFYLNCTSYGEAAIELADKIKKGIYVQVSGMLKPNNYEKNGIKVYSFRIMADVCIPMGDHARMRDSATSQKQSQRPYNPNVKQQSEDQIHDVMGANTSMPPRRRTTMPMTQGSDQQQSMKDRSHDSGQQVSQNHRTNAENQVSRQGNNPTGSGNSNNGSNMQMNQDQHEFENLIPEGATS